MLNNEEKMDNPVLSKDEGLGLMPSHETVQQMLADERKSTLQEEVEKEGKSGKAVFDNANMDSEIDKEVEESKSQHTEIEEEALKMGWRPQEDFTGNPERWVTAHQFVDRLKLHDNITHQKEEIRELKDVNRQMVKLFEKIASKDAKKETEDILRRKRDAILEGNVEDVEKYEKEYQETRQELEGFKNLQPKMEYDPRTSDDIRTFIKRNKSWYNEDTEANREMFNFARRIDTEFLSEPFYRAMPEVKRLEEVEKAVKRHFNDRFENPNRKRAPAVEGRGYPAAKDPSKVLYKDVPDEYKSIIDGFIKSGAKISRDEYAQQLFKTGAINNG